jgi:hypothetical protein
LKPPSKKLAKQILKPVKRPRKPSAEKTLHYLCQQWLVQSGMWDRLLIFHVPNERRGGVGAGVHFKRLGVRPGVADYLVFSDNRDVAIELKDEDGKQSEAQKEFQRQWVTANRRYFIVRTLRAFQEIVGMIEMFG